MNIIAAADLNWGIGKNGDLLDNIPEDMKFFREKTAQSAVIMGKNTFLSLPNQKPLPKRMNIVLTTDKTFAPEGNIAELERSFGLDVEGVIASVKEAFGYGK